MATTLNPKERQRLAELHASFEGGTFSETDVSSVLVMLRDKSNGGPIKELADSIAHSERNSREFFQRVRANQLLLNDLGKRAGVLDARYIYSDSEFSSNLNKTLRRLGFDELDHAVVDLIFLCGLSLLQGSCVKGGRTFGELHLALTSDHFELKADMPIEHNGKKVRVVFPLAAVANKWLPVCNPRAHVDTSGPVSVKVENFLPLIDGFEPFEVHIERAPPIGEDELATLVSSVPRLRRTSEGLVYTPNGGSTMTLRYDGSRLSVAGLPDYFRAGSEYEQALKHIRISLGACVHDTSGAHWFLEGFVLPPDGFHSHWVGRGSATCTRPL